MALGHTLEDFTFEKHYDHATSNARRDGIVPVKRNAKNVAPVAADTNDTFLLEAMKNFHAGQIDKETLLTLLKPNEAQSELKIFK